MNWKIDVDEMVTFLVGLLEIPSPTGDTGRVMAYVAEHFAPLPFEMSLNSKGVLAGTWAGAAGDAPRAVTAHVDTLGAVVSAIKDNGRLKLSQLGSWSWTSVEGEGATVFASSGQAIRGSFLPETASFHACPKDKREAAHTGDDMEIRIDGRTASKEETEALGIRVGDVVAFDPRVEISEAGFIRSRHLDDKAGVATIFGALRAIDRAGKSPGQRTTIHISNYEEVGHGASAGLPDDLAELLVIDMAVVAPRQTSDEYSVTVCAKDAGGPYDLAMRRNLEKLAEEMDLEVRTDVYPGYGSDGEAYWFSGGEARVALIGPGVDASHHYERTHRDALENTAKLIVGYLVS
ncbi:MAG: M42 family metallopeptidase [Chloroflexota bacterium]|nr:M42 family metallopeptidase [Chloroflexota bacterium]